LIAFSKHPIVKTDSLSNIIRTARLQHSAVQRWMYQWITAFRKQFHYLGRLLTGINKPPAFFTRKILFSVLTQLLIWWILSGFFMLHAPMEAIITRWGDYQRTVRHGIHWHMRFIEKVFKIEIGQPKQQSYTLSGLTADANLISVTIEIEYSVKDGRTFFFGICNPQQYFQETVMSVLQQAIHHYSLSDLLSPKTSFAIQKELQQSLKTEIARYPLGISLLGIGLPMLKPPLELKKDFDSLAAVQEKARKIEAAAKLQARTLQHHTELQMQALYEKANVEKYETIARAKMETIRFLALLPYYEKYPQITIQHLHCQKAEKIAKDPSQGQPRGILHSYNGPIQVSLDKLLTEDPHFKNNISSDA
jgi:HflK protein